MSDAIHEEIYKGYKIEILIDDDPENPREWDNFGTMVCWHNRYDLGDEQPKISPDEWMETLPKNSVILPLYLYDHSGITMSVHGDRYPFNDRWDAGQVGWIYVTRERIRKQWNEKRCTKKILANARDILISEVEEYNDYLTNNVYGYRIIENEGRGDTVESCWGFYPTQDSGHGYDYCLSEAKELVDVL